MPAFGISSYLDVRTVSPIHLSVAGINLWCHMFNTIFEGIWLEIDC